MISELLAAGTAAYNGISQGVQNRKNRRFQREMFDKQNAYNTPLEQVKRMKTAGLNPALMYEGTPQNTASVPNVSEGEAYKVPETLMADIYQKMAKGNLDIGNTVPPAVTINNVVADTAVKDTQANKNAWQTDLMHQEFTLNKDLFETNKQYRVAQAQKAQLDVEKAKREFEVLDEKQKQEVENLKQNYLESVARTKNLNADVWIKDNDKVLRENFVNPNGGNMVDTVLRYIIGNGKMLLNSKTK